MHSLNSCWLHGMPASSNYVEKLPPESSDKSSDHKASRSYHVHVLENLGRVFNLGNFQKNAKLKTNQYLNMQIVHGTSANLASN